MRAHSMIAVTAALLALTGGAAMAQGRGHDRDKENRGQARKAEREEARQGRPGFGDHDREIARNWYAHERRGRVEAREDARESRDREGQQGQRELPPGLRDRDRLPPGWEAKLRPGFVFDESMRRQFYPLPPALERGFTPPPPGDRYVAFGGHILLVDGAFRLMDVIHLEIGSER